MITPVQWVDGHFETRLCFRTFDWLLADQIISFEREVKTLSSEQKQLPLLSIFPDEQTLLNRLVTKTTVVNESRQADLLKSLLEPDRDEAALDLADEEADDQFQVPIVPNNHGETVFQ